MAAAARCTKLAASRGTSAYTCHVKVTEGKKNVIAGDLKGNRETPDVLPLGIFQELVLWPGLGTLLSSLREKPLHQRPFYDSDSLA